MARGSSRRRSGTPRARRPARARKPVLGNDPFERGAAPRSPLPPPHPAPAPPETAAGATHAPRRSEGTLRAVEAHLRDLAARAGLAGTEDELREAIRRLVPALRERLAGALDLVRLVEPPERLDAFGMDARFSERLASLVELLYSAWWRVEVRGIERVPSQGPAVVVANHAGVVPWDAFVLRHALRRDHPAHRELRPLLDDRECALPVVGPAAIRAGAVRAGAEAAQSLLRRGDLVGVFPEGSGGARKPWRDRYQVLRFGRGGFAKLALRTGAPVVPCAIVGSEEASPGISRPGWLAERLGLPLLASNAVLKVAPAALLPLPSKWTLRFGEPVEVRALGAAAAEDPGAVSAVAGRVRTALQAMLDEGVAARSSVYL